jgi:hypothetical protein
MIKKEKFSVVQLANSDGCFDLQFRKDTRHERTGSPTYYRWKAQFVLTAPKENMAMLEKVKKIMKCGNVSVTNGQARFSVQKIDDIIEIIIPYFNKNKLANNKKRDFDLWQKAAEIIYKNKGIYLAKWKKHDLHALVEIHKSCMKYKHNPRKQKWIDMAKAVTKKS